MILIFAEFRPELGCLRRSLGFRGRLFPVGSDTAGLRRRRRPAAAERQRHCLAGPGSVQLITDGGVMRSAGSSDGARWRVFISHTSELRDFPEAKWYVAAVKEAITAAGHVIVEMASFPASDQPAAQACAETCKFPRVRCVCGGAWAPGTTLWCGTSHRFLACTELEFNTATDTGLDRLLFLLRMPMALTWVSRSRR